jgi:hypothetical protein
MTTYVSSIALCGICYRASSPGTYQVPRRRSIARAQLFTEEISGQRHDNLQDQR